MQGFPIHQNLNTSFVDLSALVRHLRDLQFTGSVKVEHSSYEAEIIFTSSNKLQAREYDKLAGRISQGEHAFKRILVRAREPFGRVHVVRADQAEAATYVKKAFVDERIVSGARREAFGIGDTAADMTAVKAAGVKQDSAEAAQLATELILTFKDSFSKTRINFRAAFGNACAYVADRHPFLAAEKGLFAFENDEVRLSDRVSAAELFDGVVDALRHMLKRLGSDARLSKLNIYTRHRIQLHLSSRHSKYQDLRLIRIVDRLLDQVQ